MASELKPTPLLLAVLVLLWEAPMHPYQMQLLMRERRKDFVTDVKPGSIYHAIARLEGAGLAAAAQTTREGKRPERTTYRITESGREACADWITRMLAEPQADRSVFIAALASVAALTPDALVPALTDRLAHLEAEMESLRADLRLGESMQLPRVLVIESEYGLAIRQAEIDWVRGLVNDLKAGRLAWTAEELKQLAEKFAPDA